MNVDGIMVLCKIDIIFSGASDRANCSPEVMEAIKNDIIQVISKYMEIDTDALNIQITQTESESNNGTVPALFANIPIRDMKHRSER